MKKIVFLQFGLDHYAYHIVPIAAELSKIEGYEVTIAGVDDNFTLIKEILADYPLQKCKLLPVRLWWFRQLLEKIRNKPRRPKYIFKRYKNKFRQFDFAVAPTISFVRLKELIDKPDLLMAYCAHGAGDNQFGFGVEIDKFDYWLLSGPKITNRLKEIGRKPLKECSIIGYPKFDFLQKHKMTSVFDNDKTTVLYNPHFRDTLSSFFIWGEQVLEFFYNNPQYNLIFAPHIILFNSALKASKFPKKYLDADNIHVDFGSKNSVNMTYVNDADIYIGDGSSQVYEFLIKRNPCIFLNPKKVDWKEDENYTHWQLGEVVNDFDRFPETLASATENQTKYLPIQNELFERTFELNNEASGLRAAKEIIKFLKAN